ncbi:carbonic anhydrase [Silvanigrella aquatica]|uniref:carbonic anhydrase n=1 Tax=Silvanigrella aquatica TaxID=1915309 RepID=A0A1L4CZ52_9BACT|nr:carbonic anhydrase family protein [Silvanigrella aquatica]APJ03243.1 hypothetical protein AXG55_04720 [Silvanigrella aquatica]
MSINKLFIPFAVTSFFAFLCMNSAASAEAAHEAAHWSYFGENGPANWAKLDKANIVCSSGKKQSPIDLIEKNVNHNKSLPKIDFSYLEVPLKVLNNGHTIQVNYPKGSMVMVGDTKAELLQFHFHTPSEHAFDGKRTAMEVHFVNKKEDGSLLVVGVLMKKGKENKSLAGLFNNFPKKEGPESVVSGEKINPMNFLPKDDEYYTYQGSLTTPGCAEIVSWYVMKDKIEVSSDQIKKFKKLFPMDARPLQALNGRVVEEKD